MKLPSFGLVGVSLGRFGRLTRIMDGGPTDGLSCHRFGA